MSCLCREWSKSEYERKVSEEIERIRSQTAVEVDQVRSSLKDMYERENRLGVGLFEEFNS